MTYSSSGRYNESLTLNMVPNPALFRMSLLIGDKGLDIVIMSRVKDDDVIFRHIDFAAGSDITRALEEAVYDNPLLTADFHSVDVIVDNNRFFVMPLADTDGAEVRRRIDALWPPEQRENTLVPIQNIVEKDATVLVSAVEKPLVAFIRRTWHNPEIHHRLAILIRHYALKSRLGNMGKINALLREGRLDLIVFGRDGLLLANSFATGNGVDDAVYYTLGAARHLEFDTDCDRVLAGGCVNLREPYLSSLRRFIPMAMPEIYPSTLNSLASAMPDIPFENLVLPGLLNTND